MIAATGRILGEIYMPLLHAWAIAGEAHLIVEGKHNLAILVNDEGLAARQQPAHAGVW